MAFLTRRALSRRTMLRGLGAAVALPWLDAMTPAGRAIAAPRPPARLVCLEMVHGAAGSAQTGYRQNLWSPAAVGRDFDLTPTSLASLAPYRDLLTIVSDTDVPSAEAYSTREIGGDHARSSASFLTQAHPKHTAGADVEVGTSLDQIYAQRIGQASPLPSLQLCIEDAGGGGCGFGYSCVYTDAISWASPTTPLPMIRDPRVVFDELFGVFGAGATDEARRQSRADDRSILDWLLAAVARMKAPLGAADRTRLDDYLASLREVERRLQAVEARHGDGEPRDLPGAPAAVPDSFSAHVRLLIDLQVLAFASDITRVVSFKLGRDNSNRAYPESGFSGAFHPTSHHGGAEARVREFATINAYHVSMVRYYLDQLSAVHEADGSLLDNTVLLYGSPMGDSNLHDHKRVPFFLAGRGGGAVRGGRHLKAPAGTPLSNVMLGLLHRLGMDDVTSFGDSTGVFDVNG